MDTLARLQADTAGLAEWQAMRRHVYCNQQHAEETLRLIACGIDRAVRGYYTLIDQLLDEMLRARVP